MFLLQQGHVCYVQYGAAVERAAGEPSLSVSTTALPIGIVSIDPKYPQYRLGDRLHRGVCYFDIEVGSEAIPLQKRSLGVPLVSLLLTGNNLEVSPRLEQQ
jgi:hypothetical protein